MCFACFQLKKLRSKEQQNIVCWQSWFLADVALDHLSSEKDLITDNAWLGYDQD